MKTFYAINLNGKYHGTSRWALYTMTPNGMEVVWPEHNGKEGKARAKMPYQVYSTREDYPAYHFAVKGYGLSHIGEITHGLCQYFMEDVTVFELGGMMPSPKTCTFKGATSKP